MELRRIPALVGKDLIRDINGVLNCILKFVVRICRKPKGTHVADIHLQWLLRGLYVGTDIMERKVEWVLKVDLIDSGAEMDITVVG